MSADAEFLERVRARAAERRRRLPLERLEEHVKPDSWRRERALLALTQAEPACIATLSRRAADGSALLCEPSDPRRHGPSRLPLAGPRWHAFAAACKEGGAAAFLIETDAERSGCSLDDLRTVEFTGLPRLRSDWLLDEAMVLESCTFGADGVVLRPGILDDAALERLCELCRAYGIFALHAVACAADLERALAHAPDAVLAEARTPGLLAELVTELARRAPRTVVRAAGGALASLEDLRRARAAGAQAFVLGEGLLCASEPGADFARWRRDLGPGPC
jgi:indole-3-glycerol phosphate synthase